MCGGTAVRGEGHRTGAAPRHHPLHGRADGTQLRRRARKERYPRKIRRARARNVCRVDRGHRGSRHFLRQAQ